MSAEPFPLVRLRTGRVHVIAIHQAEQTLCGLAYWRRYGDWEHANDRAVTCKNCRRTLRLRGTHQWRTRAAATFALDEETAK